MISSEKIVIFSAKTGKYLLNTTNFEETMSFSEAKDFSWIKFDFLRDIYLSALSKEYPERNFEYRTLVNLKGWNVGIESKLKGN